MSLTRKTRRLSLTAAALVAAATLSPVVGSSAATAADARPGPGLRATLQRDADALLPQGAPGVLAELQTARRSVTVRSGYGDTQARTPVPLGARFRIGSLTKTFVSATLLQLVGERQLSLADTVDDWLPGLVRGHGNDGRRVTVRQLLQHTSGLPEYLRGMPHLFTQEGFEEHRYDRVRPRRAVRLAMAFEPEFAPGTDWSYSNTNYMLAGMIIDEVTGHSWRREVRQRIIRPLGLRHTTVPGNRAGIPGPHAVGYERFPGPGATEDDPDYGDPIDATRQNPTWGGAAGEMISTTRDTNRFLRALVSGRVLRPAQLQAMQRTVATNEEFRQNWPGVRYGLGLMWVPNSCGGSWAHGGDIMGFQTRNGVSADGRRSVMVTINTDSFQRDEGVPAPTRDKTSALIDHALCGV